MVFRLGEQLYAISLAAVQRVVAAVEITILPGGPAIVLGVINVSGQVIPVFNMRRRFGLPEREITPADQFLIAQTARRTVALVVDGAQSVMECPASEIIETTQLVARSEHIDGVLKLPDGLVLIHDLEKFLSSAETQALDDALRQEVIRGT
ncbi:MAG: CheW protein [Verrucomicrobia bacterium]|nr:CheW protein [Verrucomicrobiota bacterium]